MKRAEKKLTGLIWYLAVFLIAGGLALLALKLNGVAPFGPHSILRLDLNNQYSAYLAYLKRNFGNWRQFIYSNNMTLGGNMFGLTAYYLLSPFNLILFLFPYSQLPIAVAWIAVAKNGAAAASMLVLIRYFVKRYQLPVGTALQLLLAVSWGLSGWMLHFSMDIMWQDPVILLPLIILGVEHYLEKTHWAFYALMLGLALVLNYYIGYMIALFLIHYFILRLIIEWRLHGWTLKKSLLKLGYFGAISLVTVGLSWVVIWPTLKTLQGVKGTSAYHFTFTGEWTFNRLVNNFFNLTYAPRGWQMTTPVIYAGVAVMLMLVLFFCAKKIPGVIRLATLAVLVLLAAESYFEGTNVAWHGFTAPIGMSQRWAFCFTFLFLLMALFGFAYLNVSRRQLTYSLLITFAVAVMFAVRQVRIYGKSGTLYSTQFGNRTFLYNAVAILLMALCLGLYFSKPAWRRYSGILVLLAGTLDLGASAAWSYANQPPYFNMNQYSKEIKGTNQAAAWIKAHDQSGAFYRMDLNYQRSRTTGMESGFDGLTHYSSSQPLIIDHLMQEYGYTHGVPWTTFNGGSSRAADSLFGIKYIVDGPKDATNKSTKLQTAGLKKLHAENGYTIYENPDALPIGMIGPSRTTTQKKIYNQMTNVANVQHVYADLTGINKMYLIRGGVQETKRDLKTRTLAYTVPGEGPGHPLYMQLKSDLVYNQAAEVAPHIDVYLNGRKITTTESESESGVIPLGSWANNKPADITLKVHDFSFVSKKSGRKLTHLPQVVFAVADQRIFNQALTRLASQPVSLKRKNTTHWQGTATAKKSNQALILTLPYDTSWRVVLDGKVVAAKNYQQLMKINLKTPGRHHVKLTYTFPELRQGAKVSLISAGGLLILLVIQAFTVWGWRIADRRLKRVKAAQAPLFDPHYFDYR